MPFQEKVPDSIPSRVGRYLSRFISHVDPLVTPDLLRQTATMSRWCARRALPYGWFSSTVESQTCQNHFCRSQLLVCKHDLFSKVNAFKSKPSRTPNSPWGLIELTFLYTTDISYSPAIYKWQGIWSLNALKVGGILILKAEIDIKESIRSRLCRSLEVYFPLWKIPRLGLALRASLCSLFLNLAFVLTFSVSSEKFQRTRQFSVWVAPLSDLYIEKVYTFWGGKIAGHVGCQKKQNCWETFHLGTRNPDCTKYATFTRTTICFS